MKLDYDDLNFYAFCRLMAETASNLKQIRENINHCHWQFGGTEQKEFADLAKECEEALNGWMASAC